MAMRKWFFWLEIVFIVVTLIMAATSMSEPDESRKLALIALGASAYTYWRIRVFGKPE